MNRMEISPHGDRDLVMTRRFDAPKALVFRAFTEPELVKRWLGARTWPMTHCEMDFRVGGAFRYVWSRQGADTGDIVVNGTYVEISSPDRIVHTECFDEDWTGGETRVTTTFEEDGGVTIVTVRLAYSSPEARDGAAGSGMADGMEEGYQQLDALLPKIAASG